MPFRCLGSSCYLCDSVPLFTVCTVVFFTDVAVEAVFADELQFNFLGNKARFQKKVLTNVHDLGTDAYPMATCPPPLVPLLIDHVRLLIL